MGSGPVVLLLDTILRIGPRPAAWQRVALFECVAIIQMVGMAAGLYLLSRSWRDLGDYDRCCACLNPDNLQLLSSSPAGIVDALSGCAASLQS